MGLWLLLVVLDTPSSANPEPVWCCRCDDHSGVVGRDPYCTLTPPAFKSTHGTGRAWRGGDGPKARGIIRRPNPYLPGWQINASVSVPSHKFLVRFSLRAVPRPRRARLDVLPLDDNPTTNVGSHYGSENGDRHWNDPAATGTPTLTSQTADIKHRANLFQGHPAF